MTRSVPRCSASNCGGTDPVSPRWGAVMFSVAAPLQLTSVSAVPGIAWATRAG